jgi:hypothetical protein
MLEKAKIVILDTDEAIDVMFNPKEYSVSTYADIGTEEETPFFNMVNVEDFTVNLLFDTYEKHGNTDAGTDVREVIKKITKLVMPFVEGKVKKKAPICLFSWGKFTYKGIIYNITQRFTMFLPEGIPVRAELNVSFRSTATPEEYAKNMGIEACRKAWTVKSGDRLDIIAHEALKDANLWRKIAEENDIYDPLKFPKDSDIGRLLIIPD